MHQLIAVMFCILFLTGCAASSPVGAIASGAINWAAVDYGNRTVLSETFSTKLESRQTSPYEMLSANGRACIPTPTRLAPRTTS
jgi:hypothetical protein